MARQSRRLSNQLPKRKSVVTEPRHVAKVGRNDPCPCGGGKKYKDCHQREGQAFLDRLAKEADARHLAEKRQQLKDQGVPWFKRLFVR